MTELERQVITNTAIATCPATACELELCPARGCVCPPCACPACRRRTAKAQRPIASDARGLLERPPAAQAALF